MVSPVRPTYFLLFLPIFATGSIPESFGELKKLTHLYLHRNQLTGHLFSPFLGWSVPYDQPNFGYFLLTFAAGGIPESMGNLGKLRELYLDNNQLTGHFFFILESGQSRTTNYFYLLSVCLSA